MYYILKPDFIGRDRFIATMMGLGYRLKKVKNYKRTTVGGKKFYSNLIKGLKINTPHEVWQSDITYIPIEKEHYYAVFIIDVYTKKIVGYQVSDHMRATANVKALKMALANHPAPQIHHSDKGSQYTYSKYVTLLKNKNVSLSMSGSGMDNAYAERINRTIKEEYLNYWKPKSLKQLKNQIKKAVWNYNHKRHHNKLPHMSPIDFEAFCKQTPKEKRHIETIYDDSDLNHEFSTLQQQ